MDKIDKKLITLLQQNARMPLKALAEKVFLSSPAVSARIERLEKEEIIEGYEVKINQLKLGYHITAFINLEVAPVQKPEFYPFIKSCPNVVECNCVTGTYSMLLKVVFPSTMELDTFIGQLQKFGRTSTQIVFSTPVAPRGIDVNAEMPAIKKSEGIKMGMNYQKKAIEIMDNVSKVIVGKEDVTKLVLTSLIAGGHVLLEDVPGTGKTMLAKTVAKSVDAQFSRIQFTPDLLPSDVTGINYYNQKAGEFVFRRGPVFSNILLADEINRATPRTQSALLECMEEHQVTVDSDTYRLEEPFLVIATQNPIETAGTYQLPEAQLDRFLMKICMGYPEKDGEIEILNRFLKASPLTSVESVCSKEEVLKMQQEAKEVYVHPSLMGYIVDIAAATRKHSSVAIGVSPRGTLTMVNAARAFAYIEGREYIVPEDIRILAEPVFAHRLVLRHGLTYQDNRNALMQTIMESVEVPTEDWGK